ncbi:MAG: hypothetical protein DRN96_02460 [Thermoproteota archaeon]|nr:MAG: hypothetical protein DRN96_02460 [Candidatus Korarchaeota archaeon]
MDPLAELMQAVKARGRGAAIGYVCSYTPEELLEASGESYTRVIGSNSTELADSAIPTFTCRFARRCLQQMLEGELKRVVGAYTCDTVRGVASIASWRGVESCFINIPRDISKKRSLEYLVRELEKLAEFLGAAEGGVEEAIEVCEEDRRAVMRLAELRAVEEPPVTGVEAYLVELSGMLMPKRRHLELVQELLDTLPSRSGATGARVMLIGSTLTNIKLLEAIEAEGCVVVYDDLCTGCRFYWGLAPASGKPLERIAARYVSRAKCPCVTPFSERAEYITEQARRFRVQGAIFLLQKFCDPHLFEYPALRERLESIGVETMLFETEEGEAEVEKLRIAVGGFIERLGG